MLLAVLPVVIFLLSLVYSNGWLYYLGANSDPEYCYLFNSLNILNSHVPFHIDHPGTTLQILGAMVLSLKGAINNLSLSRSVIQTSVLLEPEYYLQAIHLALTVFISTITFLAGLKLFNVTQKLLVALTLQFTLLCFFSVQSALVRVSPEPLLIFAVLLLNLILIPEMFGDQGASMRHTNIIRPALAGIGLGFGIATKVTFFPLFLLLFIFDGSKKRLIVLASGIASFVFFTLPILSRYGTLFRWFKSIATHQGMYGHGPAGFPGPEILLFNTKSLFWDEPFLFVLLALYVACAVFLKFNNWNSEYLLKRKIQKLLWIVSLILTVQIGITAKHPHTHYLLPSMVATGLINAGLVYYFFKVDNGKRALISFMLIAFLLVAFSYNIFRVKSWVGGNRAYAQDSQELLSRIGGFPSSIKVGFYRSSLPGYALAFGNEFAGGYYWRELTSHYPDTVFFSIWGRFFYSYKGDRIDKKAIQNTINKGVSIIMVGTHPTVDNSGDLVLQTLYDNRSEKIYRLVGFK